MIFLVSGCVYKNYSGFYHLSRYSENFADRPATAEEFYFIVDTVKNIAEEFGFSVSPPSKTGQYTDALELVNRPIIKTRYDHLDGSKSLVDIYMIKDPKSISILVRDWKNTTETDFVKTLKIRLENELSKKIDMKKVHFKRVFSLT